VEWVFTQDAAAEGAAVEQTFECITILLLPTLHHSRCMSTEETVTESSACTFSRAKMGVLCLRIPTLVFTAYALSRVPWEANCRLGTFRAFPLLRTEDTVYGGGARIIW
jgi:hypothetical protein